MTVRKEGESSAEQPVLRATPVWRLLFSFVGLGLFLAPALTRQDAGGVLLGLSYIVLLACTWYDLTEFRVPNLLTYPGTLVAIVAAVLIPDGQWLAALTGGLVGLLAFVVLGIVSRGTVGLGDAKLVAFGGAVVGLDRLLPALLVGSISALVPVGVLVLRHRINRKQAIPYAPYLAFGVGFIAAVAGSTFGT